MTNLLEILQEQTSLHPEKTVYIFLKDGETKEVTLTYQELDRKARAIALKLQQITKPGSTALLVYPYSEALEFITAFFGCLYSQVIAVPCHPPLNRLTNNELQTRLVSAAAETILTHSNLYPKLKSQLFAKEGSTITWLTTDNLKTIDAASWSLPDIKSDNIAFLQYTSGSTGNPKGVIISHRSLLQNQEMLRLAFGHNQTSLGVGWLPLFHDMGLIGNVIQAVYLGASCVLMSPISFVQKPLRWLQAISRYQATTSGAPNFAYDLLCDQVKDKELAKLDLSTWQVAFCGAEPVKTETIARFSQKFASCGFRQSAFYPCYGMAEAVLLITGGDKTKPPVVKYLDKVGLEENKVIKVPKTQKTAISLVSCGYPWLDGQIVIANPQSFTKCYPNEIGEIWFASSSIGEGYWQLPDETTQTFQAYLKDTQSGPFLRTGDLGFVEDGELFITGRLHDVMIFWGFNHYPQHLEQTVSQSHPALKPNCGAALAVKIEGEDRLVIVQEIERSYRQCLVVDEVIESIRWAIFQQHFIDVYAIVLLKPGSLPKTSSGKVQRHLCQRKFIENSLDVIYQWYLPSVKSSNMTTLLRRYLNPLTYFKLYTAIARGRLRRYLYKTFSKNL